MARSVCGYPSAHHNAFVIAGLDPAIDRFREEDGPSELGFTRVRTFMRKSDKSDLRGQARG